MATEYAPGLAAGTHSQWVAPVSMDAVDCQRSDKDAICGGPGAVADAVPVLNMRQTGDERRETTGRPAELWGAHCWAAILYCKGYTAALSAGWSATALVG